MQPCLLLAQRACLTSPRCDMQLQEALAEVPERWWFAPHSNDCLNREFNKSEPRRALTVRACLHEM